MKADALAHEINLGQASMRLALLDLSRAQGISIGRAGIHTGGGILGTCG